MMNLRQNSRKYFNFSVFIWILIEISTMASLVRYAARVTLVNKGVLSQLVNKNVPYIQQTANISSKAWRELNNIQRPPPYDYKNKPYNVTHSWFDKTTKRFDDNTKVLLNTSII